MRADWYSKTHQAPAEVIEAGYAAALFASVHETKPRHGYERAVCFVREGLVLATANLGGRMSGGFQHVEASGDAAPEFMSAARELFPGHRVTRIDPCQDFFAPGAWDELSALCLAYSESLGPAFRVKLIGDPRRADPAGRSLILGSRSSDVSFMLYEKGKETKACVLDPALEHWVRAEWRIRPQNGARYVAARVSPDEACGFSRWSRGLYRVLMGSEVPKVDMRSHKLPDCDAAVLHMVRQYYGAVTEFVSLHGLTRDGFNRKFWELMELEWRQRKNREESKRAA